MIACPSTDTWKTIVKGVINTGARHITTKPWVGIPPTKVPVSKARVLTL